MWVNQFHKPFPSHHLFYRFTIPKWVVYDIVLPTLMSTLDDSSSRLFHWTTTIHKQCFIKHGLTLRIYHCVGISWVYDGDIYIYYVNIVGIILAGI
jgi:hypothetical protein